MALGRWPPLTFLFISVGSIFVSMSAGRDRPVPLGIGIALLVTGLSIALWLATARSGGSPRRGVFRWPLLYVVAFYIVVALAAGLSGTEYAVAGFLAGAVPLTAVALIVATARRKTVETSDGRARDVSAEAANDPFPGIGIDDETPLGDTPEHSKADA
jgi:hypothetical protein